jgi:NAD(P)-dependent dehydrogenase (short-subunit alcohol dehydrogenase family)
MQPHKFIVITGSTRGIGFGLADSFLASGGAVFVSGRSAEACDRAVQELAARHDPQRVFGAACDVTDPSQVQSLWNKAKDRFGRIDIWINNAGYSGDEGLVWQLSPEQVQAVIATNVLGTIYGTQVAVRGMLDQGSGAIYNMEGMGSDGRKHAGLTMYGTSKYAVHYFTQSTALELKGKPVIIGALRPGMVITDMITDRYRDRPDEFESAKRIFNIIADRVENVTPWLVQQILANQKTGVTLTYSSMWKMLWRFITVPFSKRDLFTIH